MWPENKKSIQLFIAMGQEWQHGMNGPTRLDKACLERFQRLVGIKRRERSGTFRDLLILEREALDVIHASKED